MNYLQAIINEEPFGFNDRNEIENLCRRVGISDRSKQITLIIPQQMHSRFNKHKYAAIWNTADELQEAMLQFSAQETNNSTLQVKSVNSVENNIPFTAFTKKIQSIMKPRPRITMILLQSDAYINHAFKKIRQVHFDFDWNPKFSQVKQQMEEGKEQNNQTKHEKKNIIDGDGIIIESDKSNILKQDRNMQQKQFENISSSSSSSPPPTQSYDHQKHKPPQIRQRRPYKKRKPPVQIDSINISISMEKPSNEPSLRSSSSESKNIPAPQRKIIKKQSSLSPELKSINPSPQINKKESDALSLLKQHVTNIHHNIATQVQQLEWASTHLFKLLEKAI